MKLLLDTHVLVWAAIGDPKLSKAAIALIDDPANTLYFSAASLWELTIKGAARTGVDPAQLRGALLAVGYRELPISAEHTLAVGELPDHHRDPFDRILAAQAQVEGLHLVTHDRTLSAYPHTLLV
jgi:PIN domain nuclease of toxin-antitoxin system